MALTKLENDLRTQARALIQEGRLPATPPLGAWGGSGVGEPCSLCHRAIGAHEVEYEVRDSTQAYRFHFLCHAAWQFEQARREHFDTTDGSSLFT